MDLSWQLNGQVADPSYHLYVGNDPNCDAFDVELADTAYAATLAPEATYYWKVVVKDAGVAVYESPIWHFNTLTAAKWYGSSWMTDADLDIAPARPIRIR